MHQYYVKVVPTTYVTVDTEVLFTNQFSVTKHQKVEWRLIYWCFPSLSIQRIYFSDHEWRHVRGDRSTWCVYYVRTIANHGEIYWKTQVSIVNVTFVYVSFGCHVSLRRHSEVEHCDWPSANCNNVFRSFMHFLTSVCAIVGGVFTGLLSFLFYSSLVCACVYLCGHVYTRVRVTNVSQLFYFHEHRVSSLQLPASSIPSFTTRHVQSKRRSSSESSHDTSPATLQFCFHVPNLSSTMFVDLTQKIPLYPWT